MNFKKLIALALVALMCVASVAEARGGFSSGGFRGGGGFSSSRSFSSSSRSWSSPSRSYSTRSFSTNRSVGSRSVITRRSYSSTYVHSYRSYGGMGMGYDYSNGLLTGLIIGDLMFPHGTTMYNGPGQYSNNALLYPNGQVVSQSGQLLGTYQNGQFTSIPNGPMVAQPAPQDAFQPQPQPVVIQNNHMDDMTFFVIFVVCMGIFFIVALAIIFD